MNIVLFEPEIPQNTGNISRTCVVTGTRLHLIEPMGFSVSDKQVKRAGLDYWSLLDLEVHRDFPSFEEKYGNHPFYFLSTKGEKRYDEIEFEEDAFLIFGKESAGFPSYIHEKYAPQRFRIPMIPNEKARSLNLSNSVGIVLYEALRQQGFHDLV
ncbi:tRNA (cytidine(34)-2'-O)-methyltransferase [Alkalibacter rhizosphaerae]|uniref:Putative tRNA (cytidine(34)-2'-O)-methyltransferase n=1 Tax=Alkalibacter rhizosphaerae TaxID=2815577 RepID=A0A974XGB5_9FIRM|nr:tRNA (cytidine(34)-2'-O)-methyltransferase [Alkalibacter rhizosphaerae]QSX08205.1 tRNA (cytidine(34)-2'-O)-methyltransferase [Alkalibacter rhizosphaerae]